MDFLNHRQQREESIQKALYGDILEKGKKKHNVGDIITLGKNQYKVIMKDGKIAYKYHGKGTQVVAPKKPSPIQRVKPTFTFVKNLGGSTGAKLVRKDDTGDLYVAKSPQNSDLMSDVERIQKEFVATRAMYVMTQQSVDAKYYDVDTNTMYTKYMEDTMTLGDFLYEAEASPTELDEVDKEIQSGFVANVLLANWDAIGLDEDNVLIKKTSLGPTAVFIDQGGSFDRRAQGGIKAYDVSVPEISTMRDKSINVKANKWFGDITDKQITEQLDRIEPKIDEIVNFIASMETKFATKTKTDWNKLATVFRGRFNTLRAKYPSAKEEEVMPTLTSNLADFEAMMEPNPDAPPLFQLDASNKSVDEIKNLPESVFDSYQQIAKDLALNALDLKILRWFSNQNTLDLKIFHKLKNVDDNFDMDESSDYDSNAFLNKPEVIEFKNHTSLNNLDVLILNAYTGSIYTTVNNFARKNMLKGSAIQGHGNMILSEGRSFSMNPYLKDLYQEIYRAEQSGNDLFTATAQSDQDLVERFLFTKLVMNAFAKVEANIQRKQMWQSVSNNATEIDTRFVYDKLHATTFYRTIGASQQGKIDLLDTFNETDGIYAFPALTSSSRYEMTGDSSASGDDVVFEIKSTGINIEAISGIKKEREVIIKPLKPFSLLRQAKVDDTGRVRMILSHKRF